MQQPPTPLHRLFDPTFGTPDRQVSRWLFLRALGLIYLSAFYSLLFQIRGLIGAAGILPAADYLPRVAHAVPGALRFWYAPTLLWISTSNHALLAITWLGLAASFLVIANLAPRASLLVCFLCYLSFIAAAQDFSSYQSDGMLLEAGFLSLFLAPRGLRPRWGRGSLPARAALFLLLWECFRIYFQSGLVKLLSGDPTWRNFTAMDEYYQNGPLPTWVGWYIQHLPHSFHAFATVLTLVMELALVWLFWLPRRFRTLCFFLITGWQATVILTANYTFLNYLVLILGFLLLDDRFLTPFVPARFRPGLGPGATLASEEPVSGLLGGDPPEQPTTSEAQPPNPVILSEREGAPHFAAAQPPRSTTNPTHLHTLRFAAISLALTWIFYVTLAQTILMLSPTFPIPTFPIAALEPFRIANQYGLFATMTPHRYEIEFQGSNDGQTWTPYPFRYKPQDLHTPPGIYAPYQPRFDWNLWFCSLTAWQQCPIVPRSEELLLTDPHTVNELFASNPFPTPPRYVRAVLYQYWFTTMQERRTENLWWRRQLLGTYAPTIERTSDNHLLLTADPTLEGPPAP